MTDMPGGNAIALFWDVNKAGVSNEQVTDAEITELVNQCWALEEYARQLLVTFDDDGGIRPGVRSMPAQPPLPRKFIDIREAMFRDAQG